MTPEPLLAPFTDKGKEVSPGILPELILELKTETGRAIWDQWGVVLLHLATGMCLPEILRPMCSAEDRVHGHRGVGI